MKNLKDPKPLWDAYQADRSIENRNQLVDYYLRWASNVADFAAIRRQVPAHSRDDLHSLAVIGLIHAVERFDPSRGSRFTSFAWPRIRGEILDGMRIATAGSRLAWSRIGRADRETERLMVSGRVVDQQEVDHRNELESTDRGRMGRMLLFSEISPPSGIKFDREDWSFEDSLDFPQSQRDPPADQALATDEWWEDVSKSLHPALREHLRDYFNGVVSLREIGERYELSESRVSQLLSAGLEQLRERFAAEGLSLPA